MSASVRGMAATGQTGASMHGGGGAPPSPSEARPLERFARFREALTADLLEEVRRCPDVEALELLSLELEAIRDGIRLEVARLEHELDLVGSELDLLREAGRMDRISEEMDRLGGEVLL